LHPQRPIVLIDELPWHELNVDGTLTLQCQDPDLRGIEDYFRKTIFRHKHFPGDMIVLPYCPVWKVSHSTGNGMTVKEETLATDKKNYTVSHKYENQIRCMEDIEKLQTPVITYDRYPPGCFAAGNPDLIRTEIRTLVEACRKNNTPCEILLKDISTADYNLENLVVWNRIAMEEIGVL